ncbi:MAG: hypothetical protein GY795_35485 [Desulfobacterales bacterium]|nr:hypothetical protein [Desulfobacterales bacterium]
MIAIKLPISLLNTNFIDPSLKYKDIYLSLLYSNSVKFIIIFAGYIFIHINMFSNHPLYLSSSISTTLLFIFGVIFAQSSFKEEDVFILNFLYTTLILMLLRYNIAPLSTIKSSRFWEDFVILFDPLLFIPLILTLIKYFYDFNNSSDVQGLTWLFLYILLGFEFTRQWLSFKLSKAATGATALGVTILFTAIAGLIEKFEEFYLIIYVTAIYLIFIMNWMLIQWRKTKVS